MKSHKIFAIVFLIINCIPLDSNCLSKKRFCCLLNRINAADATINNINTTVQNIQNIINEASGCACEENIIEISQADIPYTITAPGRYCLTENITVSSGNAITIDIQALINKRVSIDLNGYGISGELNNIPSADNGIATTVFPGATPAPIIIAIYNGNISAMKEHGIHIAVGVAGLIIDSVETVQCGVNGVTSTQAGIAVGSKGNRCISPVISNCITRAFSGNTGRGILMLNCFNYSISNCIANMNGLDGIRVESAAGFEGGVIENCIAMENDESGFYLLEDEDNTVINNCKAIKNSENGFVIDGDNITVTNSYALANGLDGFIITGVNDQINSNISNLNGNYGFSITGARGTSRIYSNFATANVVDNYEPSIANVKNNPVPADAINFTTNISN